MIKKVALLVAGAAALTLTATATMAASAAEAAQDPAPAVNKAAPMSPGIPASGCRIGYFREGSRMCMTSARGPASFVNAQFDCQVIAGRVADYSDWRYRIFAGDGVHAPVGWWLGPITADNTALFVNSANVADFDGETSRFDLRFYACAHDVF